MSGIEVLGSIAAATQIFAHLFEALFELRDQIKYAPARVRAYAGQLDSLRRTVQYIKDHPIFVTNVVEAHLETILEQVAGISKILHKSFPREPRSLGRRLLRLYSERLTERHIRESLTNLESYKSNLLICICSTMERPTETSLEKVTSNSAVVTRMPVPAEANSARSRTRALVAPGKRSDTFASTSSTGSEETLNSPLDTGKVYTEKEEAVNSDTVEDSTRVELQDLGFADNTLEDNDIGAMGNYGKLRPQPPSRYTNNSVRRNVVGLMGNMDSEALSMILNARRTSKAPSSGSKGKASA